MKHIAKSALLQMALLQGLMEHIAEFRDHFKDDVTI